MAEKIRLTKTGITAPMYCELGAVDYWVNERGWVIDPSDQTPPPPGSQPVTHDELDAFGLTDLADVTTAGAAIGSLVAATEVDGSGNPTGHGYTAPTALPISATTQAALDGKAVAGPPLQSGNYYIPISAGSATTSSSLGISTLRVAAWVLDRPVTLSRLAADISTAGEAGSKFRIGIWADDGTGWPGNLVVDAGQVNGDSATVQELTINATLPAGVYWLGGTVQAVTTTQPAVRIVSTVIAPQILIRQGTTLLASNTGTVGVSVGGVTGAFGSSFPGGGGPTGFAPRLIVKTA